MNDLARWHDANHRFLAAALLWLQHRLTRLVDPETDATAPSLPWDVVAQEPTPPGLVLLSQRLGLSRFEQETLFLCAALELAPHLSGLYAQAQNDPGKPFPTFALALSLFDDPSWDALAAERPLRFWRLLEIHQAGPQPLTASPLRIDERALHYLKGLNQLDDRLTSLLLPMRSTVELAPSQEQFSTDLVHYLEQLDRKDGLPILHLVGPDTAAKQQVALQTAEALGLQLLRLPAAELAAHAADLDTLARLWQRETLLLPVALYLDAQGVEWTGTIEGTASAINRLLTRMPGVCFLATSDPWPILSRATRTLEIPRPTRDEQKRAWSAILGESAAGLSERLTNQFNLTISDIGRLAQTVRADEVNADEWGARLWDACRAHTRSRLETLAQRVDAQATWDDLVLPAPELNTLRQIVTQVRQRGQVYETWGFAQKTKRGLGIAALFAGESGTGKTLAAEVLANALQLNLFRIDLSAVVSKYIGETEKNLRRLFDAAEDGGTILFFDEADALFGKRSEVKDSHDRYANIEINYLLQRMEAYRGLAILATNMKSALDPAFLRRLRFLVSFPFPGLIERRAIWQRAFPPQTPTQGLDLDRLTRLTLTGGSIHNVALNAAFRAADAGTPVTMELVLDAARAEFRKLERPINEADFRLPATSGLPA